MQPGLQPTDLRPSLWSPREAPKGGLKQKLTWRAGLAGPGRTPPWEPAQLRPAARPGCSPPSRPQSSTMAHPLPRPFFLALASPRCWECQAVPGQTHPPTHTHTHTPLETPEQAGSLSPERCWSHSQALRELRQGEGLDLSPQRLSHKEHPGPKQPHGIPPTQALGRKEQSPARSSLSHSSPVNFSFPPLSNGDSPYASPRSRDTAPATLET